MQKNQVIKLASLDGGSIFDKFCCFETKQGYIKKQNKIFKYFQFLHNILKLCKVI